MRSAFRLGRSTILLFTLFMLVSCFESNKTLPVSTETTVSGTGISNIDGLLALSNSSSDFYLENNIDLSSHGNWNPIENFSGKFNGNGFTIQGLTITSQSDNVGFFSSLGGEVSNLIFDNANLNITGFYENVGIVAGISTGKIDNVSVSGIINASLGTNVGGIIGNSNNSISNSDSSVDINGLDNVGGLVGYLLIKEGCIFENNQNMGDITSQGSYVGGIIGRAESISGTWDDWEVEFDNNSNEGSITGAEDYVGGIYGYISGNKIGQSDHTVIITNHSNSGIITGGDYTGGIAGSANINVYELSSSSNTGNIFGENYVGGYIGYGKDIIISYASNSNQVSGKAYVGGIAGYAKELKNCNNSGTILSGNSLTEDLEQVAYVGGIAGYTENISNCRNESNITVNTGGKYVGGLVGYLFIEENAVVDDNTNTGDITSQGSYVGGVIGKAESISGVWDNWEVEFDNNINEGDITGKADYVGGIYGYVSGNEIGKSDHSVTITNHSNSGIISGQNYTGGIVGSGGSSNLTSVVSSTNSADVTGETFVGGIAGRIKDVSYSSNSGNIYTEAMVLNSTTPVYLGGIAGYSFSIINNNNSGEVTSDSNGCYIGGISGYSRPTEVNNNINNGIITSLIGGFVGGIVGFVEIYYSVNISGNENNSSVTGYSIVGGIFGSINIEVSYSANTAILQDLDNNGNVTASSKAAGGIVGLIYCDDNRYLQYDSCTNSGDITGDSFVGGITGISAYNTFYPDSTNTTNSGTIVAVDGTTYGQYLGSDDPTVI